MTTQSRALELAAILERPGYGWHSTPSEVAEALRSFAARVAELEAVGGPFAWATFDGEGNYDYRAFVDNETYRDDYIKRNGPKYASWVVPLYTRPAVPLGYDEIHKQVNEADSSEYLSGFYNGARFAERHHGITGSST